MNFYIINNNLFDDSRYAYGEEMDHHTGNYEKCNVCGKPISMRKWMPPLKAKLSKPLYGDFVFGTFSNFLTSERFKKGYMNSGLKGIKAFEVVEIIKIGHMNKNSPQPPIYYNVLITISGAKIDEEKSVFVREGEIDCDFCRVGGIIKSFKRIIIKEYTWEGYDIFHTTILPGTVIVTQKFYDFVKFNNYTNIDLVPAETYSTPWLTK
jgi:hypothetical protein